jgi:Ni/Co efflux regulator RcnB
MKGLTMNIISNACAALALALLCAGPAAARGHSSEHCERGDPHCQGAERHKENKGHSGHDQRAQRQPMSGHDARDRQGWQDSGRDAGRHAWSAREARRGDRVPQEYRSRTYVVNDWRGHGLRRPPHGYHWVQNGSDYVLVAITTGIILELLLNH